MLRDELGPAEEARAPEFSDVAVENTAVKEDGAE